jgi:hypothetical protein
MPSSKSKEADVAKAVRSEPDPTDYNDVVARASLKAIRLIGSQLQVRPEAFSGDKSKQTFAIDYGLVAHAYDQDEGHLTGIFRFTCSSKRGRRKVVTLVGEYLLDYEVSARCEESAARHFVERLGPFAAYPYFRALHSLLTGQAGLVSPPLPILAEAPRRIARAKELQMQHESSSEAQ